MSATKAQQAEFLSRIIPLVQKQILKHNNKLYASVTIGQACYETGWGTTKKMISANSIFGVKVGSGRKYGTAWSGRGYKSGTTEYYDGKNPTKIKDWFREYDSLENSIEDYMDLLCSLPRYKDTLNSVSYEDSLRAIIAGKYATDPHYIKNVLKIIEKNELYKYDNVVKSSKVCPYPESNKLLKVGSRGTDVKYLQWLLVNKFGYNIAIDGCFGPTTKNTVLQFQMKVFPNNPIEHDGEVGKKTWSKLKA